MQKNQLLHTLLWISLLLAMGCTSQQSHVFGEDMPTMKTIHDDKFHSISPVLPERRMDHQVQNTDFEWLPNPTMYLYVFKHLSPTGLPVPGYTTFFKLYTTDHIALPSELSRWGS